VGKLQKKEMISIGGFVKQSKEVIFVRLSAEKQSTLF